MTIARSRISSAAAAAVAVVLAAGVAHSTGSREFDGGALGTPSPAEDAFADAPFGVDPVVTGPTSVAFKTRQEAIRCDKASWPDIPLACYPKR